MENLYRVKSFNVVAYLQLKGMSFVKVEKERNEAAFYYEKSKELFEIIDEYNRNIELKKFISSFKEVRTIASALK